MKKEVKKNEIKKNEINGSEMVFLIAIFIMPIITFIGLTLLQTEVIKISEVISVGPSDYSRIFFGEMILFIICWVALFISYVLYKFGIRLAQMIVVLFSFAYLVLNAYFSVNTYASIANIVNPIVVISASLYALFKPLPSITIEKRKERVKNSIKKFKPTKSNKK